MWFNWFLLSIFFSVIAAGLFGMVGLLKEADDEVAAKGREGREGWVREVWEG